MRRIDRAVEKPRDVHLVLDNYATHKTPEVKAWLSWHRRFKLHFTPTSASWLNMVERFFAEITTKRIRRGSYSSVDDLEVAIYDYLLRYNAKPKPFTSWRLPVGTRYSLSKIRFWLSLVIPIPLS